MKKNKYEDIQMIDLEDNAYITDIFMNRLYNTDKTVGVIASRNLVEYVMDEVLSLDETSINLIDMINTDNIDQYMIYVDNDGLTTVVPVDDNTYLDDIDIAYINMDGSVEQWVIDYCVNEDKEVVLFGQKDGDCDGDCENCSCMSDTEDTYVHLSDGDDGNTHGFTASKSNGNSYVSYSYYTSYELSQSDIRSMLKAFGF